MKVLIITLLFPGIEAKIYLSEDFILKERLSPKDAEKVTELSNYVLHDLKNNKSYLIDGQQQTRKEFPTPSEKGQWKTAGSTTLSREIIGEVEYLDCPCLHIRETISSNALFGGKSIDEKNTFLCKVPLIAKYLTSPLAFNMLGMHQPEPDHPEFAFDLRQFITAPNSPELYDIGKVVSMLESTVDNDFFGKFLNIPLKD